MNFLKALGPLTLEMTLSRWSLQLDVKNIVKSNIVVLMQNVREHLAVERYNFLSKFFVSPYVNAKVDNSVEFTNQDTKKEFRR